MSYAREPMDPGSPAQQLISLPQVLVSEPGYIFVYLSYEDETLNVVEFDDFKITYTPPYRGYDPTLGRFMQVDPMATSDHSISPYHYARNNPVGLNDPTGLNAGMNFGQADDQDRSRRYWARVDANMQGEYPSWWSQSELDQRWTQKQDELAVDIKNGMTKDEYAQKYGQRVTLGYRWVFVESSYAGAEAVLNKELGAMLLPDAIVKLKKVWDGNFYYGAEASQGKSWFETLSSIWDNLHFNIAVEESLMSGHNFDISLKNGLGYTDRQNVTVHQEASASLFHGGNSLARGHTKSITEDGAAFLVGVSNSTSKEFDEHGNLVSQTNQQNFGILGILGVQRNSGPNGLNDVRVGLDGGLGISIYGGFKLNIQIGLIYVPQ